jgi:superfamily II DNA/RNA helicase
VNWHLSQFLADPHAVGEPSRNPRFLVSGNSEYPEGIYSHQAQAIELLLAGNDVCLATPTASGKSLAFMSAAAHVVRSDRSARVLAPIP